MFASYNAQCCSLSQLFGWPTTQPALPFNYFNFKWKSKASKASTPSLLLSMPSNCQGLQSVHLHESSSSASVPVIIHRKRASTTSGKHPKNKTVFWGDIFPKYGWVGWLIPKPGPSPPNHPGNRLY